MTASLGRCLCIDYPDAPLVAAFGVVELLDGLRKATQKIIEGYCSRIPFFCSLLSLVDSRVVAHEDIDIVTIENSLAVLPAKNSIPTVDAVEQPVVFQLDVEPAVRFRERRVAQSTGSISCDVATSIKWLVVPEVRGNVAEQALHHIDDSVADTCSR